MQITLPESKLFEKALVAPPVFARSVSDEAISPPAPSQEIATPSARNDRAEGQGVTNHVNKYKELKKNW